MASLKGLGPYISPPNPRLGKGLSGFIAKADHDANCYKSFQRVGEQISW
jgi:hypothetical protein